MVVAHNDNRLPVLVMDGELANYIKIHPDVLKAVGILPEALDKPVRVTVSPYLGNLRIETETTCITFRVTSFQREAGALHITGLDRLEAG